MLLLPRRRHIPTLMLILQPSTALTKETSTTTVLLLVSFPLQDNIMVLPLLMVLKTPSVLLLSHTAVNSIALPTRDMVLALLPMARMELLIRDTYNVNHPKALISHNTLPQLNSLHLAQARSSRRRPLGPRHHMN
jgi:hypothetical protein